MNEIICTNCKKAFKVDEAGFADILKQVRDHQFQEELESRLALAENEKDKIYKQLKEIESFKAKIDELLQKGYNPILDDGVGKNIAPLQKKGMLAYEVLNAGQLKKYLNADW
jgi:Asp-tRNA(Asn)/Glu-tRNA(Gln) amidotransferase C subunit